MSFTLLIKTEDNDIKTMYENHGHFHPGDSGIDLFIPNDIEIYPGEIKYVDLGIKCQLIDNSNNSLSSYYLYARSSISKTPLMLKNNVGIIDSGYQGNIIAVFQYIINTEDIKDIIKNVELKPYKIKKGTRLVQICSPNLKSLKLDLNGKFKESTRGENGFGSTGL